MNKSDKEKIKKAIEELTPGGNYQKGLDILYQMVGYGEHPVEKERRLFREGKIGSLVITSKGMESVPPSPELTLALKTLLDYDKDK